MRHLLFLALALAAAVPAALPPQAGQNPKPPPDIQKIIDRAKQGHPPTPEELKKLTDWSNKVSQRFNNPLTNGTQYAGPAGAKLPQGIPCEAVMHASYSIRDGGDSENVDVTIRARLMLYPTIRGTADFFSDPLNPSINASSFRFEPVGGTGSGSMQFESNTQGGGGPTNTKINGHFSETAGAMMLMTGGTDRLFCTGGFGGRLVGTQTTRWTDDDGTHSHTEAAKEDAFHGGSDAGVPFAAEKQAGDAWVHNHARPDLTATKAVASYRELAQAVQSGKTATVTIPEQFSISDPGGKSIQGGSSVKITLRPPPYELIVEPVDYDHWVPEGAKDEGTPGNHLEIKASLLGKNGQPLAAQIKLKRMVFELQRVSREPGVCMNWPVTQPNAEAKPDLKFEASQNPKLTIGGENGDRATATDGEMSATARLTSFDWGGWCDLKVTAELPDGMEIEGHLKGLEERIVRLPKRKEDSHIGDAWKQFMSGQCGRDLTALKDDDDSEEKPAGDGDKGDGYTLYEEYRGFYENGKHFRANPSVKKLFIRDDVGGRSKDGIALFKQVTRLDVHDGFLIDEFGRPNSNADDYPRTKSLNENHAEGAHAVDQHGIVIMPSLDKLGYAAALPKQEDAGPGPPKSMKYVIITADFDAGPEGWLATLRDGAHVISDQYAKTVAHEMLHCCNVKHHGDEDMGKVRIRREMTDGGPKLIMAQMDGASEVNPDPVNLVEESGAPVNPADPYWEKPRTLYLGVDHGQHSGDEDCIMCYDCAALYQYKGPDGNPITVLLKKGSRELAGLGLCTSSAGKGCNAPSFKPRSRFKEAAEGRGNCAHQICVSDRYH